MKKIIILISFLLLFSIVTIFHPSKTQAATGCSDIKITAIKKGTGFKITYPSEPFISGAFENLSYSIKVVQDSTFHIWADSGLWIPGSFESIDYNVYVQSKNQTLSGIFGGFPQETNGKHALHIEIKREDGSWEKYCDDINYEILPSLTPTPAPDNCKISITPGTAGFTSKGPVTISVDKLGDQSQYTANLSVIRVKGRQDGGKNEWSYRTSTIKRTWDDGTYDVTFNADFVGENYDPSFSPISNFSCKNTFNIDDKNGGVITPTPVPTIPAFCLDPDSQCNMCAPGCEICPWCAPKKPKIDIPNLKPLCDQLSEKYRGDCWVCQNKGEIWSAIGCLPTDFSTLINKYVFSTGVGIAGGIAFLYFLYGAFMILTSSGNAEKMEEAKQIITSSLAGLLLIIFSIFLLKTIGVDILQLPGFK